MKHRKFIYACCILLIVVLFCKTVIANEMYKKYTAIESDIKITYKWTEGFEEAVEFNLPVVVIDGNTYIPLREAMEKCNVDVEWNNQKREVILQDSGMGKMMCRELFETLFDFTLPIKADIVNFDYSYSEEDYVYYAKIAIENSDIQYIKNNLNENYRLCNLDEKNEMTTPTYLFNKYDWWNIPKYTDETEVYEKMQKGTRVMTVCKQAVINIEDGQYFLYVVYH